jgi:hypothetical protein
LCFQQKLSADIYLIRLGVPRLNTPPPVSSKLLTESQEKKITVPKPIRVLTDRVANLDDFAQPWTRSPPKKFDQEPPLGKWQFIPGFQLVTLDWNYVMLSHVIYLKRGKHVSSRTGSKVFFFSVQYLMIISNDYQILLQEVKSS